ncbi:hypothetical protein ABU178_12890 [Pantoea osteomyelitidis]|uniref:Uncharacterized protein n=1 Tax=Pantoea osteomyelitidis TaxID=3230026 RepID=A0ABW7PZ75_9GAMM
MYLRNKTTFLDRYLFNHPHRVWRLTVFGCVTIWAVLLLVCMKYGELI